MTDQERASVQADLDKLLRDREEMLGRALVDVKGVELAAVLESRRQWLLRNEKAIRQVRELLDG